MQISKKEKKKLESRCTIKASPPLPQKPSLSTMHLYVHCGHLLDDYHMASLLGVSSRCIDTIFKTSTCVETKLEVMKFISVFI